MTITMTGTDNLALIQHTSSSHLVCSLGTDEVGSQGDEVWIAIDTTRTLKFWETILPIFNCMTLKVKPGTFYHRVQSWLTDNRSS